MPHWIVVTKRVTLTKYLVEADSEEAALDCDDGYLGYVDCDDTPECPQCPGLVTEVHGPFATAAAARGDRHAYTQGH